MSRCTMCLQGFCKRHPLQDHGERAAKLKQMAKGSVSTSSVATLLQSQICRLAAENLRQQHGGGASAQEADDYKLEMEARRLQVEIHNRKRCVYKSADASEALGRLGGLNPAVQSAMLKHSDSDSAGNSDGDSDSDGSSSNELGSNIYGESGRNSDEDTHHRKRKRTTESREKKAKKHKKGTKKRDEKRKESKKPKEEKDKGHKKKKDRKKDKNIKHSK